MGEMIRMCQTWTCRSVVALTLLACGWCVAGTIDQSLEAILASKSPAESISALVFLRDQVDLDRLNTEMRNPRMPAQARHQAVVTTLQSAAWASQGALLEHLLELEQAGRVTHWHAYWLSNVVRVDAPAHEIVALAAREDVGVVYYNYEIELEGPVNTSDPGGQPAGPRTPEPGLIAVRAPEVWAMGYTGSGVLVATLDTGVAGTHPALASRWRGLDPNYSGHPQWAWFDPVTNTTFPTSFGAHGTHTMGTVCGGAPGDQIGVAPGAQWIHAAVIDRVSIPQTVADALLAFEWMTDPDGDPNTNYDVPAVCSNSWRLVTGHGYPPCDQTFWTHLDAVEAAGTVILFSAGNEGPGAETIGRPPDRATDEYRTFSVGAVDGNQSSWPIASFSSRGPSHCTPDGSAAIKPEVVAPGVNVRSSVPGGGYEGGWSGTSMASPHVNGVVALMKEACPDLTVEQYKQILVATAHDLGTAGNDNNYGWGMVDAVEAVLMAISLCGPHPPEAQNLNVITGVDTAATITLPADDDGLPDPPAALTYRLMSLPTHGVLSDPGAGPIGSAPYDLVNYGNVVVYTPGAGYYGGDAYTFLADDGGTPPEGGVSNLATVTLSVQYPAPQITTAALPNGCLNHNYSVQLEASQGQPPLTWSLVPGDTYLEGDLGSSSFAEVGTAQNWRGDDKTWSYTLPFTFPYYGANYSSVWVCSNGFLGFTTSAPPFGNSDVYLMQNVRIAVLWDDLRTNENAGDDIFIDETVPNQVTIRWKGTTYAGNPGYPVNTAVTLFADGRIRFHYGPGNTNLTPTIGISMGDNTHYTLSSYNNATSLTNANSHEFVALSPLPDDLTFSGAGLLSGVPIETGSYLPRIKVTDALNRSAERQYTLVISETCVFGLGDLDCDGDVDFDDINPFVLALTDPVAYQAAYPNCNYLNADCDQDGDVDFDDINSFVALLGGGQ
jgi:subtilisin family serine protease